MSIVVHKFSPQFLVQIFHYTPTSASWLNMVEIFFSILSRETLRGSSFRSTDALSEAITAFVNEHNEKAKPFIWKKREV